MTVSAVDSTNSGPAVESVDSHISAAPLAVDPKQAAALMSVAERTVWAEIASGRLRSFKLGRRRLIRVVDIEAFLERRALLAGGGPTARSRRSPQRGASDGTLVPFPELEAV